MAKIKGYVHRYRTGKRFYVTVVTSGNKISTAQYKTSSGAWKNSQKELSANPGHVLVTAKP